MDERELLHIYDGYFAVSAHVTRTGAGQKVGFVQFTNESDQRRALNKRLESNMKSFPRKIYNQRQADFENSLYQQHPPKKSYRREEDEYSNSRFERSRSRSPIE